MLSFFVSFIIATAVAPFVIWLYQKLGWVDDPTKQTHKKITHTKAVPRGGGLVIFIPFIITALLFLEVDVQLVGICTSALLLTIVGVLDDIYDLHPVFRIGTGLLAAFIVVLSGIGISYITNPFAPGVLYLSDPQLVFDFFGKTHTIWILSDFFALFFILWNMNSVNWSKGVDGQLPGFVGVAMLMIAVFSLRFFDDPTQFNTTYFSLIVAGAFAGLLVWNWYPQKMMPGYGAGSLAGFFVGIAAIISGAKVATILLVLGIPTADAVFTILRRIAARKSPLWGDRGHLHHLLLDYYSWKKHSISLFYAATTFILGLIALYLNTTQKMITILTVYVGVFGIHMYTHYLQKKAK